MPALGSRTMSQQHLEHTCALYGHLHVDRPSLLVQASCKSDDMAAIAALPHNSTADDTARRRLHTCNACRTDVILRLECMEERELKVRAKWFT